MNKRFSEAVTVFHGYRLPEKAVPVGYAALIDAYNLAVPFPYRLCAISAKHRKIEEREWRLFTPRHAPDPSLEGHLKFAIKYEGIDLAVLKQLFRIVKPSDIENLIISTPTGAYTRRIWFLYEWLMEQRLGIPDKETGYLYQFKFKTKGGRSHFTDSCRCNEPYSCLYTFKRFQSKLCDRT